MNDSPYGLTASVWTNVENVDSNEIFFKFVSELDTGTVFLNRFVFVFFSSPFTCSVLTVSHSCDFVDPALAWVGVKDSGRGVSLSKFGE